MSESKKKRKRNRRRRTPSSSTALAKPKFIPDSKTDGLVDLSALGHNPSTALARPSTSTLPPERLIKGEHVSYAVAGGRIYDLAKGEEPPQVSSMIRVDAPLDRTEVMKTFTWGWEEAKDEIEEIANRQSSPEAQMSALNGLLQTAQRVTSKSSYSDELEGLTRYAHDMGYLMGLKFEVNRHPRLKAMLPFGGIQGQPDQTKDVQESIQSSQMPW